MKTRNSWLDFIQSQHFSAIDLGLGRVSRVASELGLLGWKIPVITIAGTNGKGSTVAVLEYITRCCHLDVGAFSSPHVLDFNERIRINGMPCTDAELCDAFSEIHSCSQACEISLTYFEYCTLAALLIFRNYPLDLVVLEVGLGGRQDAVNIIDADVSVITSIGIDHCQWLGDTIEKIAMEKVGIARPNNPLILADESIPGNVEDFGQRMHCPILKYGRDYRVENKDEFVRYLLPSGKSFDMAPNASILQTNLAAALVAFEQVFPTKVTLLDNDIESDFCLGLSGLQLLGRFQLLQESPHVYIDVAHNPAACQQLACKLSKQKFRSIHALVAMLDDKDIEQSLQPFETMVKCWHIASLLVDRGLSHQAIADKLSECHTIKQYESVVEAFQKARESLENDDCLIVFGSFYTVAEVLGFLENKSRDVSE